MTGKHSRARTSLRTGRRRGRAAGTPAGAGGIADARASASASTGHPAAGSRAIFRREALELRASAREAGPGVVRLGAPWIRWGYRLTLALICVGVAAVGMARTAEYSYGRAAILEPGGRFAALLPAAVVPDLGAARDLSVALPGRGMRPVSVRGLRATLATRSAVRRAGLRPVKQPSVLLTGRVSVPGLPRAPRGGRPFRTQVALVLRSRPVAVILAREFEVMLGTRAAGR